MNHALLKLFAACLFLIGIAGLTGCNGARDTALKEVGPGPTGFMIKTLVRGDRQRQYGLFVPLAYDKTQSYPVIIFLHGMGEGGNDAHANLCVGLAPFVADKASTFPFICIFPQSPDGGWSEDSESATDAIAELDAVSQMYNVDADRVSLTGLSTGGYGTWAIGAKYKERFAALVPMGSSQGDDKDASALVDMPIWAFHNSIDPFAGVFNDTGMCDKVNSLGGHAKINVYFAGGHDVWETVYSKGNLFTWLLGQKRHSAHSSATPAPKPSASLTPAPASTPVHASAAAVPAPRPAPAYNNSSLPSTPY